MIKAVIFDCFGVLVGDGLPSFVENHFGNSPELTAQAWESDDEVNLGVKSLHEHLAMLGDMAGISFEQVVEELDKNQPNQPLFNYIRDQLKPKFKIGILSNIRGDILDELLGKENRSLFDVEALSYNLGLIKPSPEIYRAGAQMLGLQPEECLFTDDKARYCDAAEQIGMQSIEYRNFEQFKKALTNLLQ